VAFGRTQYGRFRQIVHEFAKFAVVGVAGLFVTNGVYDVLYLHHGVGPVLSATIATIVAAVGTWATVTGRSVAGSGPASRASSASSRC
jgi:hypothetical protein